MKKFKLIYIPVAFMMLLGMVVIGATDYIAAGYDGAVFTEPQFWINIVTTNIGTLCLIISILLIRTDKYKETNKMYLTSCDYINEFYMHRYVAPLFKKFCYEDNLKTKIIFYKHRINRKFTRLKPKKRDLNIYYRGTEAEKKENKYCQKVAYYNMLLSDEYINTVITKTVIHYPKITDSIIFLGVKQINKQVDYITKNKTKKVFLDLLPKYLLTFCITLLFASVAPDLKDDISLATIYKTVTKIFTIISQIYFAYNYSDKYCNEVILHDIRFRETKLNDYILWESKQVTKIKSKEESA